MEPELERSRWSFAERCGRSWNCRWTVLLGFLLLGPISCDSSPSSPTGPDPQDPITITILYTNDEHGWIEEGAGTDGAAKLVGVWKNLEGYQAGGSVLVVSGGDNWTGPAVSTWFQGESTVEVMNAMGYAASAIGNHEFDFGVAVLDERVAQADFPYLSANIRLRTSGGIPGFATPFTIREVNGPPPRGRPSPPTWRTSSSSPTRRR
jgi:2',3'-cyclic-nucleotide 2'-phosphodiesterase (5'-nucleotidase family)